MRNILNIKVNSICNCTCYENINDGSQSIIIRYERNNFSSPEIVIEDEPTPLEVVGKVATFNFPLSLLVPFQSTKFKFVDGSYNGTEFSIYRNYESIPNKYYTLKLVRTGQYSFSLDCMPLSDLGIGDGLMIDEDGNLSLESESEKLISLDVTTENDLVTNVGFNYEKTTVDEYGREKTEIITTDYEIAYDANDKVIKFGDIEVNWRE